MRYGTVLLTENALFAIKDQIEMRAFGLGPGGGSKAAAEVKIVLEIDRPRYLQHGKVILNAWCFKQHMTWGQCFSWIYQRAI